MSAIYTRKRKKPEINLVPLIDVLVMLVFTSFVTMQFKSIAAMNLTLPKAESAGKNELKHSITISVTKDGALFVNDKSISQEELSGALKQIAANNKDITILIRADEKSQLKYAIEVMDLCNKYGLSKVRMQMKDQ